MPCTLIATDLGTCGLAWRGTVVARFSLPGATDAETVQRVAHGGESVPEAEAPAWVQALVRRVRRHLAGDLQDFSDVPFETANASAFQHGVYRATLAIPAGSTRSYGAIAAALGTGPAGARAVGVALATNPWPLLVPCHRVVSARGTMTGFSAPGGIRTKTRLLAIEGAELISD
jgi:methylated-DNA-[protein]-cysteine S-methyltransferase